MIKKIIILSVVTVFLVQSVAAVPIGNITVTQSLPDTIIAGSEYESHYQFDNTIKPISLIIFFNISNQQVPVNYNDFSINISLNNNELNCSEIDEGIFKCNKYDITTIRINDLKINFTSKINLQPAENYTFGLCGMIRYEEEKKIIEEKIHFGGGGGGGGNLRRDTDRDGICDWFEEIRGTDPNNPCDPNPECKACLALKLKQSIQSVWYNETPFIETKIVSTPTLSPTPEIPILVVKEPFQWKYIPIPIGIIIIVIFFLMWRRREYEDEDYKYENGEEYENEYEEEE